MLAIKSASSKAAGLTKQLLAFSRKQLFQPLIVNPNSVISDLNDIFRRLIGEDIEIRLELDHSSNLRIKADPSQLEQILLNLLVNARDAIQKKQSDGGDNFITIKTDRVTISEDYVRNHIGSYAGIFFLLSVSDTGVGMEQDVQQHVFEPFFTTKEQGTGLGLSTVYGIVKQSKGFINIESERQRGTTLNIFWPVTDEVLSKADVKVAREKLIGNEGILLVEDDTPVREFTTKILEDYGYSVYAAGDGENGLEQYKENRSKIDILITDMIMPKMNGSQLTEAIKQVNKEIKVLYISGYADKYVIQSDLHDKKINFVQK